MQPVDSIFYVLILIMSIVVHEFAHGYAAYLLGDNTARLQGRLTLNPLKHLDPFGSVILPGLLVLMNAGFVFGWARPVPYNPNNLRNYKTGTMIVSIAGIFANLVLVIIFGLLFRYASVLGLPVFIADAVLVHPFYKIAGMIVMTNLMLAIFNLMPVPPLDGSKVLFALLPARLRHVENFLEKWGIFVFILFVFFLGGVVFSIVSTLFPLVIGYDLLPFWSLFQV